MLAPCVWIAVALTQAGPAAPASSPPRVTDPRLVLEQIAREPAIVTPTGLAVDSRGRVLVIESHTHFRPKDYVGPRRTGSASSRTPTTTAASSA